VKVSKGASEARSQYLAARAVVHDGQLPRSRPAPLPVAETDGIARQGDREWKGPPGPKRYGVTQPTSARSAAAELLGERISSDRERLK